MERVIERQVTVRASIDDVWQAWTSSEGAQTFFAPKTNIRLAVGGDYEILFFPDNEPGMRGGEGLRILSYLPKTMLSFEWNAPPQWPAIRGQLTWVVVQFEEQADGVRVRLTHLGWKDSNDWDEVYAYFEEVWDVVLGRYVQSVVEGPLDWVAIRAAQAE